MPDQRQLALWRDAVGAKELAHQADHVVLFTGGPWPVRLFCDDGSRYVTIEAELVPGSAPPISPALARALLAACLFASDIEHGSFAIDPKSGALLSRCRYHQDALADSLIGPFGSQFLAHCRSWQERLQGAGQDEPGPDLPPPWAIRV